MIEKIINHRLFSLVLKFGSASLVATLVDYLLYTFVFTELGDGPVVFPWFTVDYADLAAAFCGMLVNFFLQKNYVFKMERGFVVTFLLSILFSLIILLFGSWFMHKLKLIALFAAYPILAKIIVTGIKFIINFFTKKWVFEKKLN